MNHNLEKAIEDAKQVRAFLQGLAYANGCKNDVDIHQENAWHYSNKARMICVNIESYVNCIEQREERKND